MRSLLTLKALTYYQTGGIVAAPTTSLPEQIGGTRNWDYRFCWLRDATLTLLAMMDGGYYREAEAWRNWLLRAAAGSPDQLQIMYGLGGERLLREWEVTWLPGYEGSSPVRVGNAAHGQMQLDVYGEVMDALHQARLGGISESDDVWQLQKSLAAHLEKVWRNPDQGIWEVRGAPQQFTHSKVMAWVAIDRAVKSAEHYGLDGPIDRWRALRDEIHADVCEKAFDPELNAFVQAYGSKLMDASLLLIPLVGFLPPTDPRVQGTVAGIEKELLVDGFVLRYDSEATDDGLPPGEGAFLACSFWLADDYMVLGRVDDARQLFERLLSLRNDVGLLAEGYDPRGQRQLGNFPQAFSHIALVSTAFNMSQALGDNTQGPATQRVDGEKVASPPY
jgi:GH15 family glucan-1,4-alpha-glucosidase